MDLTGEGGHAPAALAQRRQRPRLLDVGLAALPLVGVDTGERHDLLLKLGGDYLTVPFPFYTPLTSPARPTRGTAGVRGTGGVSVLVGTSSYPKNCSKRLFGS
jgi:hypothetical protein